MEEQKEYKAINQPNNIKEVKRQQLYLNNIELNINHEN